MPSIYTAPILIKAAMLPLVRGIKVIDYNSCNNQPNVADADGRSWESLNFCEKVTIQRSGRDPTKKCQIIIGCLTVFSGICDAYLTRLKNISQNEQLIRASGGFHNL